MELEPTLDWVLGNIKDPHRWTDADILMEVLRDRPSVRGMVYGFLSEIQFAHWLDGQGIPLVQQEVDDDHAKTKSDRTFPYDGRRFTVQVKSMQTNSIKETGPGTFKATVQCDGSDRRDVTLPNGHVVNTTNYVAGEFMILAVTLHPFIGQWDYAFRLNSTLDKTVSKKYSPEDQQYLLKTVVPITWPLEPPWTTDLFALLDDAGDLGEVLAEGDESEPAIIRPPGGTEQLKLDDG